MQIQNQRQQRLVNQQIQNRIAQQQMEKQNLEQRNVNITTLTLDIDGNSLFTRQNNSNPINDIVFGNFCQRNRFTII